MAHEKYFLVGKVKREKTPVPHNTIINNYTMYDTKADAMTKADQLIQDDKNLLEVSVCYVSAVKEKTTGTNTID